MKLLVFSAEWCGACKVFTKALDDAGMEYTYIDIENEPKKGLDHKVTSLPTSVIVDSNGDSMMKFVGYKNPEDIKRLMK